MEPESDPISQQKNKWYSSAPNPAKIDEGLYDYCSFCLDNFKQFHPTVNNVCQSCGRVAEPVMRDKQQRLQVTSVNSPKDNTPVKAVSLEIDYKPLDNDPTNFTNPFLTNERMAARSQGEAMKMIRTTDQMTSRLAQAAALSGQKFILKTNIEKDKDKIYFDNDNNV